ncbi:MAG: SGNH/GDSL hydrolase family protein [Ignavibacteria bacterium]
MKKFFYLYTFLLIFILALGGCKKETNMEPPVANTGSADFSKFVTIGNSITAGYQSGALYNSAQIYSFGNLIAKQVKVDFQQPLFSDPGTGDRMELTNFTTAGDPVIINNPNRGIPLNISYATPYNNLGIPGAFLYDVLNATNKDNCFTKVNGASANPLFDVILRNSALNIGSQFQQAKALKATFVTLWIGNNDILGHATSGGVVPYTPVANFQALYSMTLDSLATLGAKVVVANIPDVSSVPFLTTVGPLLRKKGYPASVYIQNSNNEVVLASLASNYITLRAAELIIDPAIGNPTGIGTLPSKPFPNDVVLDSAEATTVSGVIAQYNAAISSMAAVKGFGIVDMNAIFKAFKQNDASGGTVIDGITFKTDYISGGLFSLDGVHPSSRGQGIIANEFIKVINVKFGANISQVYLPSIPTLLAKEIQKDSFGFPVLSKDTFKNLQF